MADWSLPTNTSLYTTVLSELDGRLNDAATMFQVGTETNVPTNAVRFNTVSERFERYSAGWNEQLLSIAGGGTGANTASGARTALSVPAISDLTTHSALTSPHSATASATASRLLVRDINGRAAVAAPAASTDIALKSTVTTDIATHYAVTASSSAVGHMSVAQNDTLAAVSGTYTPLTRTVTAGSGLTGGGSLSANITLNHSDTSSQASMDNSGNVVVQDVTIDTYGHVTSLGSTTIDTTPTTAQVGAATKGLALGAIGSYAFLLRNVDAGTIVAGTEYAGSTLKYSGVTSDELANQSTYTAGGSSAPAGTWQAMGYCGTNPGRLPVTIFLRTV